MIRFWFKRYQRLTNESILSKLTLAVGLIQMSRIKIKFFDADDLPDLS